MKHLWAILSTIFTIAVFYIFYKMIHSKNNSNNANQKVEKWGYWKSTKIFVCLFILFSALFYSLQNFSWVQRWLIPSTAVLGMHGGVSSEDDNDTGAGVLNMQGGGGGDYRSIRERSRSDAHEKHIVVPAASVNGGNGESRREENYNRVRSHRESNYDYNDNILTDPPNF